MSDRKLPAVLFYFSDWNNDPKLKLCSLSAQALWLRMLGVMHTCEPYGYLTFRDGLPATAKEIALVTGVHTNRVTPLVTELERHGVFSRNQGGVIFSRRMVRDEANRLINQQNGQRGGNPWLRNPVNPPLNRQVNQGVKAKPLSLSLTSTPLPPQEGVFASQDPTPPKTEPEQDQGPGPEKPVSPPPLPTPAPALSLKAPDRFPAKRNRGFDFRANGTSSRAMGTNPRALAEKEKKRQAAEQNAKVLSKAAHVPPAEEISETVPEGEYMIFRGFKPRYRAPNEGVKCLQTQS
jgi:hypothetical protein